ncbi:MAG: primosomal protein N' [Gemmatimonadetes bacterium]|nr:primosomal protein N' [Gemmatimonadota bacterium]
MIPLSCTVALPLPVGRHYRYQVPASLADRVVPGARVVVPVRARELIGVVLDISPETDDMLKPVLLAPDDAPLISPQLLDLADWVSRYYVAPHGITLRTMLPPALWGSSKLVARLSHPEAAAGGVSRDVVEELAGCGGRASATRLARRLRRPVWDVLQRLARSGAVVLETEPADVGPAAGSVAVVSLTRALPSLLERHEVFGRAEKQRAVYEALDGMGGEAEMSHLTGQLGHSPGVVRALVGRGVARIEKRPAFRDPFRSVSAPPPDTPTEAQRAAVAAIEALDPGQATLLFGVTASGKTLVYLEAMRAEVARGKGAIVLVPEIALTAQTVARVRGVFGDTVAVMHSGLSEAERADAWRAVCAGERRVVVGARSAVFAPVPNLGIIVVDEEHDASYKQGEAPRYHAREVALRRGRTEGARVVLGSATPSLETWSRRDAIPLVTLPARATAQPLPAVRLIDLRHETLVPGSGPVPWSAPLDTALDQRLVRSEQVILLLNRRGFAHFLQCPACGQVGDCPSCSIALTVHQVPLRLKCHYCGHEEPVPDHCPACGHATQRMRGVGTQLLERWLGERFPTARLARMDADTTSTKWSHGRILDSFARREIDVLFGTQMIAKGLDFPGVTLVGVVDADSGLHLPDFRAAERTFQLVAQVSGRAGRGARGGEVFVQTRSPAHYALASAALHDFRGFADRETELRRSPAYPPHVGLANVIVSGEDQGEVGAAAVGLAEWLRGLVAARAEGVVEIVGPSPAPLERIKGRWRWHLLVRSPDPSRLGRILRYTAARSPAARARKNIRVAIDRDPVSLL